MKRHIFTVSILLVAAQLFGQESRFWVGGSGKWADENHWATVSGGEPGATVPESGTSVVFDENSFSGDKNTVTLGNEVSVGSLTASNAAFVVSGKKDLIVKGSVSVDANVDFGKLRGALVFDGNGSYTISLPVELESDVVFNNGTWTLLDGLNTTGTITVNGGVLNSNNNKISCKNFVTNSQNVVKVDFGTSEIDVTKRWEAVLNNSNSEIDASNASLTLIKGIDGNFRSVGNVKYNKFIGQGSNAGGKALSTYTVDGHAPSCKASDPELTGDDRKDLIADGYAVVRISHVDADFDVLLYRHKDGKYESEPYGSYRQATDTVRVGPLDLGLYGIALRCKGVETEMAPFSIVEPSIDDLKLSLFVEEPAKCFGSPIQKLSASVSGGNGGYTYYWENYGGRIGGDDDVFVTDVADWSEIFLTLTDAKGCQVKKEFDYYSAPEFASINSYKDQPTRVVTSPTGGKTCEGSSTGTVEIRVSGGQGMYNYFAVYNENGDWGGAVEPTAGPVTIENLAAGTYNVVVKDTNGCVSASNTAKVDITNKPVVTITPTIDVCEGKGTYSLVATAQNMVSVKWETTNGTQSSLSNSDKETASYKPTAADITRGSVDFNFIAVAEQGCPNDTTAVKMNIWQKPKPQITIADNQEFCADKYDAGLTAIADPEGEDVEWSVTGDAELDGGVVKAKFPASKDLAVCQIIATQKSKHAGACDGADTITMSFRALPTISISADQTSPVCGNVDIKLTATTPINTVTWEGGSDGGYSSKTGKTTTYKPINDQGNEITLTAKVNGVGMCATESVSASKNFTIKNIPNFKATAAAEVCDTVATINLSGHVVGSLTNSKLAGAGTYILFNETASSVDIRVDKAGNSPYSIKLTETQDGCSVSDTVEIKFNQRPDVAMKLKKDTVCLAEGEGHTIKTKKVVNCSVVSWSVSNGTGGFDPLTGESVEFTPTLLPAEESHTYTIIATGTPAPGTGICKSTYFDDMTLVVNRKPDPSIEDNAPYCAVEVSEDLLKVTVSASNVLGSSKKLWNCIGVSEEDAYFGDKTAATTDFFVKKAGQYKIQFTETLGKCSKSTDVTTIDINGVVKAETGNDTVVCPVPDGTITIIPKKVENGVASWSGPNGWTATTTNPTYTITAADTAAHEVILTLKVKRTDVCPDEDSDTQKITFFKVNTPKINGNKSVCYKSEEEYETEQNMQDYVWDVDGGTIMQGQGTYKIKVKWESDGDHDIKVSYKDANQCVTPQGSVTITVNNLPTIGIAGAIEACAGEDKQLDGNPTGATPFKSHSWTGKDVEDLLGGNTDIQNPTFNAKVDGDYSLTYTVEDANSCKNHKDVIVKVVPGPSVVARDTVMCFDAESLKITSYTADNYSSLSWDKIGDGDLNTSQIVPSYVPGLSDRDNKEFKIIVTANGSGICSAKKDTINVAIMPEMIAAVGGESPYLISASTRIKVTLNLSHENFGNIGFYLTSPDGKEVKLYDHRADIGISNPILRNKSMVDLSFTTWATSDLNLIEEPAPYTGEFKIKGDWSDIYGEDPAKGGWSVVIKSTFGTNVGVLKGAYIEFTDKNMNGEDETIRFDSKEISETIPYGRTLRYISPIGLYTKCFGSDDPADMAHAIVFANGGSGTYNTYNWSTNGAFTNSDIFEVKTTNRMDLAAGTFYVRVFDTNGCHADASVNVYQPDKIQITLVERDTVDCFGDNTGILEAKAALGVGEMTCTWSNLQEENSDYGKNVTRIENLLAGKYNFHVEDGNKCKVDSIFEITQPASAVEITNIAIKPSACEENTGEVTFTVEGGTADYTIFDCSDATATIDQSLLKVTKLAGDSISFKIKDFNGCPVDTTVFAGSADMKISFDSIPINFYGENGTLAVIVEGGAYPFSFAWSNGATDSVITVKAGKYSVEIIDANGCKGYGQVALGQPDKIEPSVEYIDPLCYGYEGNVRVKASAKGGVPVSNSYSYAWLDENNSTMSTDSIFENAVPGTTYYLSVKDQYGEVVDTVEIANPAQLTVVAGNEKASDCTAPTGSAEVTSVTGGLAPYKYNWYALFDENTSVGDTYNASNLGVDFYVVEVTDSLGCKKTDTVEITGGGNIAFEVEMAGVTCATDPNGQAHVYNVTSNGSAATNVKIFWNNGNDVLSQADTIKNLAMGLNKFMVKADEGCRAGLVEIDNSRALRVADEKYTPLVHGVEACDGGFEIVVAGGSGEYEQILTDAAGNKVPSTLVDDTVIVATGLCAGAYNLHIDIVGGSTCPVDFPITIIDNALSYDTISASNGITHVKCMGDSTGIIVGNAVGGYYNDEYVYEWRSDVWGEDSVRTTASIDGLPAGIYNLKVFQYHERIVTEQAGTANPQPMYVAIAVEDDRVIGRSSSLEWLEETYRNYLTRKEVRIEMEQTAESGQVLQYSVKDTLVYEKSFEITEPTTKFAVLADSIKVEGSHCYDAIGSISIGVNAEAFNGTPASYTFSYDGWATDYVTTTPELTNLKSGDYRMVVKDVNGCSFVDTITIEDLSNFAIDTIIRKEPDCHGFNNGFIKVKVDGGNGNLHFSWTKDGKAISDSTALLVGQASAMYVVKIVDDSSCVITQEIKLEEPDTLLANVVFDQPIVCYGDTVASFHSAPMGGTEEFSFLWTDAITGDTLSLNSAITNAGEGSYAIKVVDKNMCWANDTIVISYPDSLYVEMAMEKSECAGTTGYAAVKINGGVAPYVVSWTAKYGTDSIIRTDTLLPGVMVDTLKNIGPDMYYVTVADALGTGCSVVDSVEVLDDGDLKFIPTKTNDIYCINIANGGAVIPRVMNGKTFEIYSDAKIIWNAGKDTVNIGDTLKTLHYGKNIVQVISMPDGCRQYGELELDDDLALHVSVENIPVRGVETASNGALIAEVTGGYPNYTCIWQNEAGDTLQVDTTDAKASLFGLNVGRYILYVKDQNPETCEIIDTIDIKFEPLRYDTIVLNNVTCNGWNDGKIEVKGKGGLHRPYFYEWSSPMWPDSVVVNTPDIADLKAGQYMLKMWQLYSSDSVECLYDTIVITEPSNKLSIEKLLVDSIPSHCYDSIGAIVINQPAGFEKLFGGSAPFTYTFSRDSWSVELSSGSEEKVEVTGLTIGDYKLYVRDSLGCDYNTTITINDLSEFRIKNVVVEKPICYDEFGTITVTPTSKNGGFKYSWMNDTTALADTTAELLGIKAGTYIVKVTDDSLCVKFDTIEVTQPKPIIFSVSNTIENSCFNVADGEVSFANITGGWESYKQFLFVNPDDSTDVKLSVDAKVDTTIFTLSLNEENYNLISGKYNVLVKDAVGCLSDPVSLVVNSKYPQIDINSYISTADVTGPDCQVYTADGKISDNGWVKINFKQVSGTVSFKFDDRSVTEQQQPTFDKVASGNHLLTIGYTNDLVCAVTDTIKVKGKDSFAIEEAGFYQNGKNSPAIFTCADNELSAYVTASGKFSYSFYAQYIEEPVETIEVPVDTVKADSNGVAYVSRYRKLRFYADSLEQDSSATEAPVVVPEEVKKPAYSKLETINGVVYAVFTDSSATNKGWADFMPYGGETYYYVSVSNGKCMDIDSIKATAMKPVNKLNARLSDDETFKLVAGRYEVAEGALVTFEANTPEFEFGDAQSVFSENYWTWKHIGGSDYSALIPELDSIGTGNPMTAKTYGELVVQAIDTVVFTAYDDIYRIDTTLSCVFTDKLEINSIDGIKPMEVFTPNGDEYNETWRIDGLASYSNVTIYVFNRWGGRVWQYSGSGLEYSNAHEWDGRNAKNKPLPAGTYYYVIQCSDDVLVGKKVTGPVTIIR